MLKSLRLVVLSWLAACVVAQEKQPNFVLIFTDDQGYQDVGCYGSPDIATPNLDRMAREGMRFTDFYSGAPVCSASRAALLTGSYCDRVGVTGVFFPNRKRQGLHPDEQTVAEVLKGAGYATACIGKWHLGDEPHFLPTRQGFDRYFGIPYSNDMRIKRDGKSGPPLMRDTEIVEHPANQATLTQRYTREAVQFLEQNKERPFFLYLPHTMPHIPLFASEDFRGKSKRGLYGDTIEEIDWSVGQILATLKRLGLDDNTLVIFTSDNGPWLSMKKNGGSAKPLRDGKFTTFEGGMRVPCLMRWPGRIPAGKTCREVCSVIDVLPTFTALAGAGRDETRKIDGHDITPLLEARDGAKSPHEALFLRMDAVRAGDWKLMLKARTTLGPPAGKLPLLFNLRDDVSESKNVAAEHPEVVARLKKLIQQHRRDIRDNGRPVGKTVAPADAPRVLLLGDSISIGYTRHVQDLLGAEMHVFRPTRKNARNNRLSPENCCGTDLGLERIDAWLAANGGKWDVIHFNFGLHDLKHVHPETGRNSNDPAHPRQTEVEDYERQLATITDKLVATGAKLIFATTTPYPEGVRPLREVADVGRYNAAAKRVMEARGIAINDLHAFALPRLEKLQNPKNVHFSERGSTALGNQVVKHVRAAVAAKK